MPARGAKTRVENSLPLVDAAQLRGAKRELRVITLRATFVNHRLVARIVARHPRRIVAVGSVHGGVAAGAARRSAARGRGGEVVEAVEERRALERDFLDAVGEPPAELGQVGCVCLRLLR